MIAAPPPTMWRWMRSIQEAARGSDPLVLLRVNLGAKATRSGGAGKPTSFHRSSSSRWALKGERNRSWRRIVIKCYGEATRNLHRGEKCENGIDFARVELEVGGENGSGRETKGIF